MHKSPLGKRTMFSKTILVNVDSTTWPSAGSVPRELRTPSGHATIDLASALLMLGTLTMPNVFSPASPGRFWAWLRYFLAPAASDDLRVTMDFSDLDPHQKGILSDDFGVAISTQWLFDRLGGFCRYSRRSPLHVAVRAPASSAEKIKSQGRAGKNSRLCN
jgi:hypothetical protein